ncbi:EscU/YscU/HrcU family type III secretion system export apparatus switch protein [Paenibacillus albicereus]|uniref:EscU/YscU/HrcU family type III secretion system export apparatus switch protein n=1 Tax=Paenibacillus albicereus TaxID=2726185 RepID=A0A6H2GY08_9BACL|nr:EscU/YscU/HrcU family type III secretion system export apparatus switch protein [Paenibacillus albicereus]QJC52300.1 EscU/YscU/HrcU family type III secretion system export apparatus switch protein [Paenibacillus albicereus]
MSGNGQADTGADALSGGEDRSGERRPRSEGDDAPRAAVALRYDPADGAPAVVAKGKGQLADEIVQRARENGVPVQEDRSLVEVLSKLDLNQQIPAELYELVAELLSFIYQTDRKAGALSGALAAPRGSEGGALG